jgi:hypothetical protein
MRGSLLNASAPASRFRPADPDCRLGAERLLSAADAAPGWSPYDGRRARVAE